MNFQRPVRSRSQVQIIPMIDILIFLLIFLVISTQFKKPQKPRNVLHIELPTVREVPSDTIADTRSIIAVDADGVVTLDGDKVQEGLLESYLAAFQKVNPGRKLELEADRKLPLERLLSIWDSMVKAGIQVKDVPARIRLPKA